jgi:structural maintenance of chromosome 4
MKPKAPTEHEDGLLEYLEDIIGTSKYKEPIDEALVKMEQLQEERQVKLNRLRLVEKEKSALEAKKREAEDYLRLKNEHVRALSRLWQWYLWQGLMHEEQAQLDVVCGFSYLSQNKAMNVAFFFFQEKYQKMLAEETDKNKDDITHLEMLRKHFRQREAAYEVIILVSTCFRRVLMKRHF